MQDEATLFKNTVWRWPMGTSLAYLLIGLAFVRDFLPGGDGSEILGVAQTNGVAHPPGFPLNTILSHAFGLLSPFPWPYSMHLFALICASVTAGLLCLVMIDRKVHGGVAALAALFVMTSTTVLKYATEIEVFALHHLVLLAFFSGFVYFQRSPNPRRAALCCFVAGLSLSQHHEATLVLLPFAAYFFVFLLRCGVTTFVGPLVAFALGLSPYLDLWLGGHSGWFVWGHYESLGGVVDHFLREQYGTLSLASGSLEDATPVGEYLILLVKYLGTELYGLGLVIAFAAPFLARRDTFLTLTAIGLVVYGAVFVTFTSIDLDSPHLYLVNARFWQLPLIVMGLFLGVGLERVVEVLKSRQVTRIGILAALLVGIGLHLASSWSNPMVERSDLHRDFYRLALRDLPKNALLVVDGDSRYNLLNYLVRLEGVRTDVDVVSPAMLSHDWYVQILRRERPQLAPPPGIERIVARNSASLMSLPTWLKLLGDRPIFLSPLGPQGSAWWQEELDLSFSKSPFGPWIRLLAKGQPLARMQDFTATLQFYRDLSTLLTGEAFVEGSSEYVTMVDATAGIFQLVANLARLINVTKEVQPTFAREVNGVLAALREVIPLPGGRRLDKFWGISLSFLGGMMNATEKTEIVKRLAAYFDSDYARDDRDMLRLHQIYDYYAVRTEADTGT